MSRGTVSAGSERLFRARARARRRLSWRPVLIAGATAALIGGLAWLVLGSGAFAVRAIDVTGTRAVPVARVREATGVVLGTPLARVNVGQVERAVEAALPQVRTVVVSRSWPSTLRVLVTERVAAAVRVTPGQPRQLVDRDGVVLGLAPSGVTLPVVQVPAGAPGRLAGLGLEALEALPPAVAGQVSAVKVPSQDAISLVLRDGRQVLWGGPEQASLKARVLAALLKQPAAVYDVSAPEAPAVRGTPPVAPAVRGTPSAARG